MSEVLLDVLGKPLDRTFVIFEEVELEDWGWGGMPTAEFREIKADQERQAAACNLSDASSQRSP
jgi:phenylpyruvate tautomerase PptA (4-oxalocrotonate tautomerase family)